MPSPLVASRLPSGLKQTLETLLVCPGRVSNSRPLAASQILAVLSQLPVASRLLSGLKHTLWTACTAPAKGEQFLPADRVPDFRRLVFAAGRQPFAVRAETHAMDLA